MAYAADHLALAVLEKMAGVQRAELLTEMIYVRAEIATRFVEYLPDDDLPRGWDALPAGEATRQLGHAWLRCLVGSRAGSPPRTFVATRQASVHIASGLITIGRKDVDANLAHRRVNGSGACHSRGVSL